STGRPMTPVPQSEVSQAALDLIRTAILKSPATPRAEYPSPETLRSVAEVIQQPPPSMNSTPAARSGDSFSLQVLGNDEVDAVCFNLPGLDPDEPAARNPGTGAGGATGTPSGGGIASGAQGGGGAGGSGGGFGGGGGSDAG